MDTNCFSPKPLRNAMQKADSRRVMISAVILAKSS